MMSRPNPSNWFLRFLSIKDQVSLAMEQDSSLTLDVLAFRKNLHAMANLTEESGIPSSDKLVGPIVSRNVTVPGNPDK